MNSLTKRQVFFSFHYELDSWRVNQIKQIGAIEGQKICNPNEWEQVKRQGDNAIKRWIDDNMKHRSCVIVLIGKETAGRKWVKYEIEKAWKDGKGLMGIYIHNVKDSNHNVKDSNSRTTSKGLNPFDFIFNSNGDRLSKYVPTFNENGDYGSIREKLHEWIEMAIENKKN